MVKSVTNFASFILYICWFDKFIKVAAVYKEAPGRSQAFTLANDKPLTFSSSMWILDRKLPYSKKVTIRDTPSDWWLVNWLLAGLDIVKESVKSFCLPAPTSVSLQLNITMESSSVLSAGCSICYYVTQTFINDS